MKAETWKKVAKVCGAVGLVGGAASLGAGVIHFLKPETVDIPAEQAGAIKKLALEAVKEANENKS